MVTISPPQQQATMHAYAFKLALVVTLSVMMLAWGIKGEPTFPDVGQCCRRQGCTGGCHNVPGGPGTKHDLGTFCASFKPYQNAAQLCSSHDCSGKCSSGPFFANKCVSASEQVHSRVVAHAHAHASYHFLQTRARLDVL